MLFLKSGGDLKYPQALNPQHEASDLACQGCNGYIPLKLELKLLKALRGFPTVRGTFLGVPMVKIAKFGSLHWVSTEKNTASWFLRHGTTGGGPSSACRACVDARRKSYSDVEKRQLRHQNDFYLNHVGKGFANLGKVLFRNQFHKRLQI